MAIHTYVEKCVETIARLNFADISSMERGELVGSSLDMGSKVYSIGSIMLDDRLHLAVKISKNKDPSDRLINEVSVIDEIINRVPLLENKMPIFIGLLAVESSDNPVSIITEDATAGGSLPIHPMPASDETAKELKMEFGEETIEDLELANSLAFDVDGVERWLDFTPSPVRAYTNLSDPIMAVRREIKSRQDDFTVVVSNNSALAHSIQAV